jgi:hypothetical protein
MSLVKMFNLHCYSLKECSVEMDHQPVDMATGSGRLVSDAETKKSCRAREQRGSLARRIWNMSDSKSGTPQVMAGRCSFICRAIGESLDVCSNETKPGPAPA